jgi:hypothetical protein
MHIAIAIAAPAPRRGRLTCPVCGDAHVMPTALAGTSLLGQRGEVRVDQGGLHLNPAAPSAEAGSAIAITFRCGSGHLFGLRLRTVYETTTAEMVALPFAITAEGAEQN